MSQRYNKISTYNFAREYDLKKDRKTVDTDLINAFQGINTALTLIDNLPGSVPGTGDVTGPASSTDNNIATFNGATGKIIKDSGVLLSSLGDVVGPSSATDNAITRYDGTTGKLIQNSNIKLLDTDIIDIPLTTAGSAGGILLESTSSFGSAHPAFIQHKGSADERVNIYNHLNVVDEVFFGTSGTGQGMFLGNSSKGFYPITGQYSATSASLRMLSGYRWEFTSYLFATAMSIGSSNVSGLNAAPTNGLLVEGYVEEQAGHRILDQDFSASATTTLAKVTGASGTATLEVNVTAGKWYTFEAKLFVDVDVVGGHKYSINGTTTTATSIIYNINSINNATNAFVITSRQTSLGGSAGQVGPTAVYTEINGTIKVNAAGTLNVQFAQNVASGVSTVLKGSSFVVKEIFA